MCIIFDALDEYPNSVGTPSPRENVLDFVEWLVELQCPDLHICVTSRPEVDHQSRNLVLGHWYCLVT